MSCISDRSIWRIFDQIPFERTIAAEHVQGEEVLKLLDYPTYFNLLELPIPDGRNAILSALKDDALIQLSKAGGWDIMALVPITKMDKADRIRACYLHACIKRVMQDYLTNASLRERFGIEEKNKAIISRYIRETVEAGAIKPFDDMASRKMMKYVPCWA